ncbi:unnamed protein product [Tetraodon nigroviridis]|uniref:(spotted green pufferfish) hypothetical protein n=1 Tax=Tetraodon nigroviridis TaxID=99883 RepID=Q4SUP6_TETNG|nr:unnamed protein product [Tetraodon nigroviridis]
MDPTGRRRFERRRVGEQVSRWLFCLRGETMDAEGQPAPGGGSARPPELVSPSRGTLLLQEHPESCQLEAATAQRPSSSVPPFPSSTQTTWSAPPVPAQPPRAGVREAPPPPPSRMHGSPSPDNPVRGRPPPPPSRTPAAPPPPPPALRNGHSSCSIPAACVDDFESKYSFHPLDDFPPPEEYRHFTKIYPSRANRGGRGPQQERPPFCPSVAAA